MHEFKYATVVLEESVCLVEKVQRIHSHFTAPAEENLCGLCLSARRIEHITAHLLYDEALSIL